MKYKDRELQINEELIKQKGLSNGTVKAIRELHFLRAATMDLMTQVENDTLLPGLASVIEDLNYQLQDLWGFPRDSNFHEWYGLPKCTCPIMDNQDARGTSNRCYSGDCPVHSPFLKEKITLSDVSNQVKDTAQRVGGVISEQAHVAGEKVNEKLEKTRGLLSKGLMGLANKLKKD